MKRLVFFLAVFPWVVVAACRVAWIFPHFPLDETVGKLRNTRVGIPGILRNPQWLRSVVSRLLPLLPPPGAGRCLRRSLMLLDLWSRCGMSPIFFMGIRPGEERPSGHAWVVTDEIPARGEDLDFEEFLRV